MAGLKQTCVLVVDDEERIRDLCSQLLSRLGYSVTIASNAKEAMAALNSTYFNLLLVDIKMPGITGDTLIEQAKKIRPDLPVVIMTGFPTVDLAISGIRLGVSDFLTKPFKLKILQEAVRGALEGRRAEVQRIQRQFAAVLVESEKKLGDKFDLRQMVERTIKASQAKIVQAAGHDKKPEPAAEPAAEEEVVAEKGAYRVVVLCEAVPQDVSQIKRSEKYRHMRTVYAAQRILNKRLEQSRSEVKLVMASTPPDLVRHLRRYTGRVCSIIFGPNFPQVDDALVRLVANGAKDRLTVVCFNPEETKINSNLFDRYRQKLDILSYMASTGIEGTRTFWTQFFTRDIYPLIANLDPDEEIPIQHRLKLEDVRDMLAKDPVVMEEFPAFPHVCKKALEAIEEGRRYAELAEIFQLDAGLQAAIIRTANLVRYGSRSRIEKVPNALTMIGMEETQKIIMAKVLTNLMALVNEEGANTLEFFVHSVAVGYMGQILSLNWAEPSQREREILKGLDAPEYMAAILKKLQFWTYFELEDSFDSFTAGILHDVGKLLNGVCYPGVFPLIMRETERLEWKGGLLESERALVGEFEHPITGGALLSAWEVFPELIGVIRDHHIVNSQSAPQTVLLALANGLAKGFAPFPRSIKFSLKYRQEFLGGEDQSSGSDNPLIAIFERAVKSYNNELARQDWTNATDEIPVDKADEVWAIAQDIGQNHSTKYMPALMDQNPEFAQVVRYMKVPVEDFMGLSVLLSTVVRAHAERLLSTAKMT